MPTYFNDSKVQGAIIYEDTHTNQLVLNMFNSNCDVGTVGEE